MRVNKMNQPNTGIKCVVNSCEYYMNGDHCSAERIEVQPRNAHNSQETDCATFIAKSQAIGNGQWAIGEPLFEPIAAAYKTLHESDVRNKNSFLL